MPVLLFHYPVLMMHKRLARYKQ